MEEAQKFKWQNKRKTSLKIIEEEIYRMIECLQNLFQKAALEQKIAADSFPSYSLPITRDPNLQGFKRFSAESVPFIAGNLVESGSDVRGDQIKIGDLTRTQAGAGVTSGSKAYYKNQEDLARREY
jgi:hypothetical protein